MKKEKLIVDPAKVSSWRYRMAFLGLMLLENGGKNHLRVPRRNDIEEEQERRLAMARWHCGTSCCVAGYSQLLFDRFLPPDGEWAGDTRWDAPELRHVVPPSGAHPSATAWYLCDDRYPDSIRQTARRIIILLEHADFFENSIIVDKDDLDASWPDLPHADYAEKLGIPVTVTGMREVLHNIINKIEPCLPNPA